MCLVQTPYYHNCGHYGTPVVAPYGRCARAEGISGACWESKPIGIKTVEAMCGSCTRAAKDALTNANDSGAGPVDINKFNKLVKLHKKTCDRRYWSDLPDYQYDILTPKTVQAKPATLLIPHPTPSYQLQMNWLYADHLPPAQFPSHPLRPAPCRQKVGIQSSSSNNLITSLSSSLPLGAASTIERTTVRGSHATSTVHQSHHSYTTPFDSHGVYERGQPGALSVMTFRIAIGVQQ